MTYQFKRQHCKLTVFGHAYDNRHSVYVTSPFITGAADSGNTLGFAMHNLTKNDTSKITDLDCVSPQLAEDLTKRMRGYFAARRNYSFIGRAAGQLKLADSKEWEPDCHAIMSITAAQPERARIHLWIHGGHNVFDVWLKFRAPNRPLGWITFDYCRPGKVKNCDVPSPEARAAAAEQREAAIELDLLTMRKINTEQKQQAQAKAEEILRKLRARRIREAA